MIAIIFILWAVCAGIFTFCAITVPEIDDETEL